MDRLACRVAMHDAERHARNIEAGNQFYNPRTVDDCVATARAAYLATPESTVAQRLHVAIDRMEMNA